MSKDFLWFHSPYCRRNVSAYKKCDAYYFSEIGVATDNEETILSCRARGFESLESIENYLSLAPVTGSYGEKWSVRKVLRLFIWHDRIHAKAMYRMGKLTFGEDAILDIFGFDR